MKTLLGMVTFGNLPFTKLAIRSLLEKNDPSQFDLFVVCGKPGDLQTPAWLAEMGIEHIIHDENKGFPASINDIYDRAFVDGDCDAVIIAGNDIVSYPHAVDALISTARESDWQWICSSQFDARALVARYPEAQKYFTGPNLVFTDFDARPWELHTDLRPPGVTPNSISDVRNLALFKRDVFCTLGYADANFWPGGYFEDNDYCRRALLAGVPACTLAHSAYFHFWSRTIHQGGKGGEHHVQFNYNSIYYVTKWGGGVGAEKFTTPFNGERHQIGTGDGLSDRPIYMDPTLDICSREHERAIAAHWRSLSAPA